MVASTVAQKYGMKIVEVLEKRDWKWFHQVPHLIYQAEENYIAPLEMDVEAVFSPAKNKMFEHGDAACFVLLNEEEKPIGRIAAFIDHERNASNPYPVGGMGFFECIKDQKAAHILFQKVEEYLEQWSVKAIDGPINFGEREKFCGLLIKGRQQPLYQENFHPEYYKDFLQSYGYQAFEQILTFHGIMKDIPIERFTKIAERVEERFGFRTLSMDKGRNIPRFAGHFAEVYNIAFRQNPYFKPLTQEQVEKIYKTMKPIADLRMVFITYEQEKPVAFAAFIPDINPFLKRMKGKLKWYQLPRLVWQVQSAKKHLLKGVAFGIDPSYQRKGAFASLVNAIYNKHTQTRFPNFYLATIRGHNTMMVKSISNLGVELEREHHAFRKMLDDTIPLDPFDFINTEDQ